MLLSMSRLYLCPEVAQAVPLAGHMLASFWSEEYKVFQPGTLEISHMIPMSLMLEMAAFGPWHGQCNV